MRYSVFLLFTSYLLLVSCQHKQKAVSPEELAQRDSLALHVAVVPVMDCLPIYYAERRGIFQREGLDVRLTEYLSLMDCDTALQQGHAELAYADIARLLELQGDSAPYRIVMGLNGEIRLVTAKSKRIRSLKHLKERMIALDRHSAADYWSDELMKQAGLEQSAVYRPQINDVQLRTTMLEEQLVDAALLPQPYAQRAALMGNIEAGNIEARNRKTQESFACLATQRQNLSDSLRNVQIRKFVRAYNEAVKELNGQPKTKVLKQFFVEHCAIPASMADSLNMPHFTEAALPKEDRADIALAWLQGRERLVPQIARDSLFAHGIVRPKK